MSSAKMRLIRFASVIQWSIVISGLPTLAICSTFTRAYCRISGTALTSSWPRNDPALYSVKLVDDEPFPEIVPPVESTHTRGKRVTVRGAWAAHGAIAESADASNRTAARPTRRARTPEDLSWLASLRWYGLTRAAGPWLWAVVCWGFMDAG